MIRIREENFCSKQNNLRIKLTKLMMHVSMYHNSNSSRKKNAIKPEPLGRMTDSGRPFSSPEGEKRFVTGNDFLHFPLIDD
jgi:hypothetical protein